MLKQNPVSNIHAYKKPFLYKLPKRDDKSRNKLDIKRQPLTPIDGSNFKLKNRIISTET